MKQQFDRSRRICTDRFSNYKPSGGFPGDSKDGVISAAEAVMWLLAHCVACCLLRVVSVVCHKVHKGKY